MLINLSALQVEISTDPKKIGLSGPDAAIAAALNVRFGPGAEMITVSLVSHDDFVKAIAPQLALLSSQSSDLKDKWDRILTAVFSSQAVSATDSNIQAMFVMAETDNLLTSDQVTAISTRLGSRAEKLFGENVFVFEQDVINARSGRTTAYDGLPSATLRAVDTSGLGTPTVLANGENEYWITLTIDFILGSEIWTRELSYFFHTNHDNYLGGEIYPTTVLQHVLQTGKGIRAAYDVAAYLQSYVGQDVMPIIAGMGL